ncbi:amidohydrolase [Arenibacterium sp. LLYu02]|uniref:amidohydrolase n=1 Tax=Arenibacterium sp. LLYu02 TaxID=3404132 RepID=UPI003B226DED
MDRSSFHIKPQIQSYAAEMQRWRRHLHQYPELDMACHETAAFVAEHLRAFGVDEVHEGIAESGVVGVIYGQQGGDNGGPITGLRADMDALPIHEATGAAWQSTRPGRMHACGHDGHTTMLLGAARYLAETRQFSGKVVLLFQPGEEGTGGGRIMVEEGVLDRFGVEEVYAIHNSPTTPLGQFNTCIGPYSSSFDDFEIIITGRGGHASMPADTIDPIAAAFAIGQAIYSISARNIPSFKEAVISLTMMHAGDATNVIPDQATLAGTIRCLHPELRDLICGRVRDIVKAQELAFGVTVEFRHTAGYSLMVNHAEQTHLGAQAAAHRGAGEGQYRGKPGLGSEDFAYMLEARPGSYFFVGQGVGPGLHNPSYDFNDALSPIGASYLSQLIEERHQL